MNFKKIIILASSVILALSMTACFSDDAKPDEIMKVQNVALGGYDSVEYFVSAKAVKGSGMHTSEYKGATWLFNSRTNKEAFDASTKKYVPVFRGYDAYELEDGNLVFGSPQHWRIHNNRLFIFEDEDNMNDWYRNIATSLPKAIAQWDLIQNPPKEDE